VFVVGILGDLKIYHYVAELSEFVLCDVHEMNFFHCFVGGH
jgi:hypothetical protein